MRGITRTGGSQSQTLEQLLQQATDDLATRESLLSRLRDWEDNRSWREFFDVYWRLIYGAAIRAGMNDAEAKDVLQETLIAVSRRMPTFQYDSKKGSFKGWLLQVTRWKIADQFRRRQRGITAGTPESPAQASARAGAEFVKFGLESAWEEEWERHLFACAIQRVKRKANIKAFQVFDEHIVQGFSVAETRRRLGVSAACVYVSTFRISRLLEREIRHLRATIV